METMRDYFSYNRDYNNLPDIFNSLYKKLNIIHDNGMCVPRISSDNIFYDEDFSFDNMVLADNIELRKRENIIDLSKLFLGTYLSLSTGFKDFSFVDTEWFSNNLDSINSSITSDNFYPEYFSSVFFEGKNNYYHDFLENVRRKEELNSMSNNKTYKKILSNAASGVYSGYYDEQEQIIEKKPSAYINTLLYPTLILCGTIVSFVIYTCLKFLN